MRRRVVRPVGTTCVIHGCCAHRKAGSTAPFCVEHAQLLTEREEWDLSETLHEDSQASLAERFAAIQQAKQKITTREAAAPSVTESTPPPAATAQESLLFD